MSIVHNILQLVDVATGQQALQVLGGVPAQQCCATFHDGLQVVDGFFAEEVFDIIEDGRKLGQEPTSGLGSRRSDCEG